jgi:hypothetical protein
MLGLHAVPKEDFNISAAELAFGFRPRLPGELLVNTPAAEADLVRRLQSEWSSFVPLPTRITAVPEAVATPPPSLQNCAYVYVRKDAPSHALAAKYDGPYRVLVAGGKFFRVAVGNRQEVISVNRLKPHIGAAPSEPALPPRRGRPRKFAASLLA